MYYMIKEDNREVFITTITKINIVLEAKRAMQNKDLD